MNYLGKYLKRRLKELKMSEREISAKCGISHSYLNQLIKGINPSTNKNISPTLITFEKLAVGFNVPIDHLQKIARGCVVNQKKLELNGDISDYYSPQVIKQINDFHIFMKEIGINKKLKTEEEWCSLISKIKEIIAN
ncbi:MAG TPA: helix-turn-helix transcriptional regulator [Candidatus Gastranaerophilales bacterium]|nr:helix-turn-helix transcriptional regulator [Candidatus Gastranaerophilales bacterium]